MERDTSHIQNTLRIRFGKAVEPMNIFGRFNSKPDCISCTKNKTGIVPADEKCQLICRKLKNITIISK
jgi:hypothetical protein